MRPTIGRVASGGGTAVNVVTSAACTGAGAGAGAGARVACCARHLPLLGRKQRCEVGARIALRDTEYHLRGGGVNATMMAASASSFRGHLRRCTTRHDQFDFDTQAMTDVVIRCARRRPIISKPHTALTPRKRDPGEIGRPGRRNAYETPTTAPCGMADGGLH